MNDCLFCKIIKGEIPCDKIYEDDEILAFKDINPVSQMHILIITKRHISSVSDASELDQNLLGALLIGAKKIAALQPLNERIGIKYHLEPLDFHNTLRYLLFRLKSAGATRGIFTKDSVVTLYEYSKGIPLRINNICDRSLLLGMMTKARVIENTIVNNAIEDLK